MVSGDDDFDLMRAATQKLVESTDFFRLAVVGEIAAVDEDVAGRKGRRREDVPRNPEGSPPIRLEQPMSSLVGVGEADKSENVDRRFDTEKHFVIADDLLEA